jgi:hypothetical protein
MAPADQARLAKLALEQQGKRRGKIKLIPKLQIILIKQISTRLKLPILRNCTQLQQSGSLGVLAQDEVV